MPRSRRARHGTESSAPANTLPNAIGQAITWLQGLPARALAALALLGVRLVTFATNAWHSFVTAGISAAVGIITWVVPTGAISTSSRT